MLPGSLIVLPFFVMCTTLHMSDTVGALVLA
jgi:ABC-type glycerol-3-phosphate transport system permease component